jgi:hypothetical protein
MVYREFLRNTSGIDRTATTTAAIRDHETGRNRVETGPIAAMTQASIEQPNQRGSFVTGSSAHAGERVNADFRYLKSRQAKGTHNV